MSRFIVNDTPHYLPQFSLEGEMRAWERSPQPSEEPHILTAHGFERARQQQLKERLRAKHVNSGQKMAPARRVETLR